MAACRTFLFIEDCNYENGKEATLDVIIRRAHTPGLNTFIQLIALIIHQF